VAVILCGGLSYYFSDAFSRESGAIKIGLSLPLTGEAASYGEASRAGFELALKEINDAGGINGRPLALIYEDDKCDSSGASVFQKLISIDHVTAIIGPLCSAAAGPAVPIASSANIPTLLVASAPGLTGGDDSIFRDYPSDSMQGSFIADYVYKNLGKHSAAILYVKNDWGAGLEQVFKKRFMELGGTIVFDDGAPQDATDVRSMVTKMKLSKPDVIFLPAYPSLAINVLKDMHDLGMKIPVIGGDALVGDEFLKSGIANGVLVVTGSVNNPDAFQARIHAREGDNVAISIFTPVAYDALSVLAQVMREKGTNASAVIDGLKKLHYTKGVSFPEISYDHNGDLLSATYDVNIVRGTKLEKVVQ
jgi:branched-chain amino acid transport system substrate-binding protein